MSIYTPKGPAKQKPKLNCWRVLYYLLRDVLSELGKFRRVISDTLIVLHVTPHDIFTVSLWECLKWRSFSLSIYDLNFRKTLFPHTSQFYESFVVVITTNDDIWKQIIMIQRENFWSRYFRSKLGFQSKHVDSLQFTARGRIFFRTFRRIIEEDAIHVQYR